MGKQIRWVPPHSLVEISCRCIQARFLLRPSPELNEIFLGVLIMALRESGIRIHYIFVLSGHYHFLATVPSTGAMAEAMEFLQGNLSKEVGRLHDWPGTLWEGPYHHQIVDSDEATQIARLEYLLAQSCAAGLTSKPSEWPGIHAVEALLEGRPLVGKWISRRSQWAARNRKGADSSDEAHSERLELTLDPLPCWEGLPEGKRRERAKEIVERIEMTTRARHAADGTKPAGRWKILAMDPHHRPEEASSSPQPIVLARNPVRRKRLWQAVSAVVAAFLDAAEKLAEGNRSVCFPRGNFSTRSSLRAHGQRSPGRRIERARPPWYLNPGPPQFRPRVQLGVFASGNSVSRSQCAERSWDQPIDSRNSSQGRRPDRRSAARAGLEARCEAILRKTAGACSVQG